MARALLVIITMPPYSVDQEKLFKLESHSMDGRPLTTAYWRLLPKMTQRKTVAGSASKMKWQVVSYGMGVCCGILSRSQEQDTNASLPLLLLWLSLTWVTAATDKNTNPHKLPSRAMSWSSGLPGGSGWHFLWRSMSSFWKLFVHSVPLQGG